MKNDIGNYASHAKYWDWGGQDNTAEYEYWRRFAAKYGSNVLIPMCATGGAGAYMAERGMNVTAFDITPEMIAEGQKRFGSAAGLRLLVGDVRSFNFDIPPADFCYSMDFGHLLTLDDVKKAIASIGNHLRDGGCLVIETGVRERGAKSSYHPPKTFFPQKQMYPGIKVWKTGDTRNNAETGRCHISQTFFAEDEGGKVESFDHSFSLQSYYREEWLEAFRECGFDVTSEYSSRELASWLSGGSGFRIFEAVKRSGIPKDKLDFAAKLVGLIDSGEGGIFRESAEARSFVDCEIYEGGVFHSCEIYGGLRIHVALSCDTSDYNEDIALRIRRSLEQTRRTACNIWLRNENKKVIDYLIKEFDAKPGHKHFYASIEFIMRREDFHRTTVQSTLEVKPYEENYIDDYLKLLDGSMTFTDPPQNFSAKKESFMKRFAERRQENSFEAFWKDGILVGLYWRKHAEIDTITVAADHQRKGYGSLILSRAIDMVLRHTDADYAYLYAVDWNTKGQSFYRKYGMEENGHSFGITIKVKGEIS